MERAGLRVPRSAAVKSMREAERALAEVGLPAIVRPGFTMGGQGGGIARNESEFRQIVTEGLAASPIGQVLVEESVIGWGEFELEVMRDRNDNVVIVCSIENVDPMGVHTGDSVTVAPQQTLSDRQYQALRDQALTVIRAVGVETGGSNIQFAVNPATDEIVVIEMNPRVSRSSALASKATGFPIAKIAARLAVGYALEEIDNDITRKTPASFEPAIDYVVVKWPRFAFEKFPGTERHARHLDAVGGRGHGDRPHRSSRRSPRPCARASSTWTRSPLRHGRAARAPRDPLARPLRAAVRGGPARRGASRSCAGAPASTPGSWPRWRRWRAARTRRRASSARSSRWTPAPPSSRPRRPTTTRAGSARPPTRCAAATGRAW